MIRWTPYSFVRITCFLAGGVLWGINNDGWYERVLIGFCGLLFLYLVLTGLQNQLRDRQFNAWLGLTGLASVFLFGYLLTWERTASHQPNNLVRQGADCDFYEGTLVSEPEEKARFVKARLRVGQVHDSAGWHGASGVVMLYIRKEKLKADYHYGDQLVIRGRPTCVPAPLNPGQFDYQDYLARQQIYHQHFAEPEAVAWSGYQPPNLMMARSIAVRRYLDGLLRKLIPSGPEYAIATGVVLGVKEDLDADIKQAYASAGAMHVLAVSGMQVALFYGVLTLLLGQIKRLPLGQLLFAGVVLLVLWMYAFVTGLSASVLRAVVMFSFVVVAQAAGRRTNLYNTLAVSAFALLCFDPYLLLDVGFQLSYLAVLGIVYLHPRLYRLLNPESRVLDFAWNITCVSLAAQLATLPVSLLYFHQFPSYFLIANLFIIPLSTAVLYVGLVTLALAWVPVVSGVVAWVLQGLVWLLNQCVFITETLPGALVSGISISTLETVLLYVCGLGVLGLLARQRLMYLAVSVLSLAVVVGITTADSLRQKNEQKLYIYGISGHPTLDIIEGQTQTLFTDTTLLHNTSSVDFNIRNNWNRSGINSAQVFAFNQLAARQPLYQTSAYRLLVWNGHTLLFIHGRARNLPETIDQLKPEYVVLQQGAVQDLKPLAHTRAIFVLDASNPFYLRQKLKDQSSVLHLRCHDVMQDGAFVIEL